MKHVVTLAGNSQLSAAALPAGRGPGMAVASGIVETMLALLILILRAIVGMQRRTMDVDLRTDAVGVV
jgi:hypothetical protein